MSFVEQAVQMVLKVKKKEHRNVRKQAYTKS